MKKVLKNIFVASFALMCFYVSSFFVANLITNKSDYNVLSSNSDLGIVLAEKTNRDEPCV